MKRADGGGAPPRLAALLALAGVSAGCWAQIAETRTQGDTRPVASERARSIRERERLDPVLEPSIEGELLLVEAAVPARCRSVRVVPSERVDLVTRTLRDEVQTSNVLLGGAFVGLGAAVALGDCTDKDDLPCSAKEQQGRDIAAYAMMGAAVVPATLFVVNAIRAADRTEVVRVQDQREPGEWQLCGRTKAAQRRVALRVGDRQLETLTSASGNAAFDLSAIEDLGEAPPSRAVLTMEGAQAVTVSLHGTAAESRWLAAAARARAARLASERAELEDAAWRRSDPGTCRGPDGTDPDAAESACGALARFLEQFPESAHVNEAEGAIVAGRARLPKLRAAAARRQREAEAASRRAEERARARQLAEEARRAESCRAACIARCRPRADFAACLSSCTEGCRR